MTEAAALSAAIADASSYILAGDPVEAACQEAAQDHGLNPKLVQNRLLAGIGATVETARDVLRASAAKAQTATQANKADQRQTAEAAVAKAARQFRNPAPLQAAQAGAFEYKGIQFLFVAAVRTRKAGSAAEVHAVQVSDGLRYTMAVGEATFNRILNEAIADRAAPLRAA